MTEFLREHREAWGRKPALRAAYRELFRRIRAECTPRDPIVELGCGPGFFKELHPDVVATDVFANPYADQQVDAGAMPFSDGSIGNLVMLDVFHHLEAPAKFLREASRVLEPGGRVVMIEPWLGLLGFVFYSFVHHEGCDRDVDVGLPFSSGKDPMEGNAAVPHLYFRAGGHLETLGLPFDLKTRAPFAGLPWLLTGGFSGPSFAAPPLARAARALEPVLNRAPRALSTRCLVVLEKRLGEGKKEGEGSRRMGGSLP
ncbi:MAG: class I SAM-dependent methyltransferase [Deltaproteobacteria bacterium]|nr:class I SAM-dependent methyltransferase [Deltaproteobacteria bacterium]